MDQINSCSDDVPQEMRQMPPSLLIEETVCGGVFRTLLDKQSLEFPSFVERIIAHISQTFRKLSSALDSTQIATILGDDLLLYIFDTGHTYSPHECMWKIFNEGKLSGRTKKAVLEKFIEGYRQIIRSTVNHYYRSIPSDILKYEKVRLAINQLFTLMYAESFKDPITYQEGLLRHNNRPPTACHSI